MKTSNLIKIILLQLLLFSAVDLIGQQLRSCGDLKVNKAALQKAEQFERLRNRAASPLAVNFLIRVYFHIGAYNDGSNPVTTLTTIRAEFDSLRNDYAAAGICFSFAGYDFMNNSNLDTNFNANTDDPALFDPYRISSCINVFYIQKIKGNNSACANNCGIGGTSLAIPNTFCLISQGNIGAGRTISHEVGHCMGLMHTFSTSNGGPENIDGSNSATAGDHIEDTPADPYSFNGKPCYAVNGCTYQGTCQDPNGETNYVPPYTNLMSYWLNAVGRACVRTQRLTNGQYSRVISFLSSDEGLQSCQTFDANYTINPISKSTGYFFWEAINSITTSGNVNLSGTLKSAIGASNVKLNPGFHAVVSPGGRIVITGTTCN